MSAEDYEDPKGNLAESLREFFQGMTAGRRALRQHFTNHELMLLIFACDGWRDDPGTGKRQLWRADFEHFEAERLLLTNAGTVLERLTALGLAPTTVLYGMATHWWRLVEQTPDGQWPDFDGWLQWAFEQNGR